MIGIKRSTLILLFLGSFNTAFAQLPPEIMADKHLIHAEQLHAAKDYTAAFDVMQKIVALQKQHDLKLPDEFHFKYAQVALSADSTRIALESVTTYLSATGKEGEHYKEALALLIEAEETQILVEETCAGKPEGALCWKELANHPQCYVWDDYYYENQTVTWSGKCSRNLAHGKGTLSWEIRDKDGKLNTYRSSIQDGVIDRGKKQGQWVERGPYASVSEGPYVDGNRHGRWVSRGSRGRVYEGSYADGKKQGHWVERSDYSTREGSYVDGKKQGQWVVRYWSGAVMNESYLHGKRHGEFYGLRELCGPKENSKKVNVRGKYVAGERQGYWENYGVSYDAVGSGRYVDDERQGSWKIDEYICRDIAVGIKNPSVWTTKSKGEFIDGEKNGNWFEYRYWDREEWRGWDSECWSNTYSQGELIHRKKQKTKKCRQVKW